ncbi:sulfur carrier protein ThiS [Thalassospira sp. A3_1]|uniref:sulfur carrier protein ThiS n=1 Tax=Thalassospira sp. A3_1 TaxID=2821088 RepID=UPI001ADB4C88|nr:sulfur carrier protein ThiS [Thalassospira sp. A3_1]MBO9509494.1 sulfur carrier protein ThiS [Thalassospira sp. A3_1]
MRLTINGEDRTIETAATVADLLGELGITATKVAVERNLEIVPKTAYGDTALADGDKLEIVHFIGGGSSDSDLASANDEGFVVAGHKFKSRLIVGTGKYKDFEETRIAIDASGAEMVTVAVRRVNLTDPSQPMLVDYVDPKKYVYLPNTAGCFTADDSVRTLRLAREAGGWNLVKLEVLGDQKTLYPNMPETLKAAEALIKDGFDVMVYCSDDPIQAKMLEDMGCVAIMPLGSLIGSGMGILNPVNIALIKENANVPVIVDAGVGTASDAAFAMELGCDGVLMNTAIAGARDPIRMARAMKHAIIAGRESFLAGRMPKKKYADPSSPLAGLI